MVSVRQWRPCVCWLWDVHKASTNIKMMSLFTSRLLTAHTVCVYTVRVAQQFRGLWPVQRWRDHLNVVLQRKNDVNLRPPAQLGTYPLWLAISSGLLQFYPSRFPLPSNRLYKIISLFILVFGEIGRAHV